MGACISRQYNVKVNGVTYRTDEQLTLDELAAQTDHTEYHYAKINGVQRSSATRIEDGMDISFVTEMVAPIWFPLLICIPALEDYLQEHPEAFHESYQGMTLAYLLFLGRFSYIADRDKVFCQHVRRHDMFYAGKHLERKSAIVMLMEWGNISQRCRDKFHEMNLDHDEQENLVPTAVARRSHWFLEWRASQGSRVVLSYKAFLTPRALANLSVYFEKPPLAGFLSGIDAGEREDQLMRLLPINAKDSWFIPFLELWNFAGRKQRPYDSVIHFCKTRGAHLSSARAYLAVHRQFDTSVPEPSAHPPINSEAKIPKTDWYNTTDYVTLEEIDEDDVVLVGSGPKKHAFCKETIRLILNGNCQHPVTHAPFTNEEMRQIRSQM